MTKTKTVKQYLIDDLEVDFLELIKFAKENAGYESNGVNLTSAAAKCLRAAGYVVKENPQHKEPSK